MSRRPGAAVLWLLAPIAAGLFAYWGAWSGGYVFDDRPAITDNTALLAGDWWRAAFGDPHQPLANRPFTCLTLVLDFALFGPGPFGPHLTNMLLHMANGVLLAATLRRALLAPNLAGRFAPGRATGIAVAVATLWAAHPLGVDAVAYATQRSTLLFGGFLLAALYAVSRAHAGSHRRRWQALAVAAVALGMASKEDMVVAPLLVVAFERAFLVPSWSALRERRGFHAAIAATWLLLGACVALGPSNPTVGFETTPRVSAWEWLMTQSQVVLHYLRLAAWPHPLRGAYDWGVVREPSAALLPGLGVIVLLGAATAAWRNAPWWGFLGALFFLLLAPTSTVMPIVSEIVAERRAYLPMLAVLVPLVIGADRLLSTRAPAALVALGVAAAALGLGLLTQDRVGAYADETAFWADAHAKRDPESRSFLAGQLASNYAVTLWQQGRFDEAHRRFDRAIECEHPTVGVRVHHAVSLQQRGRNDLAIARLRELAASAPDHADALGTLGIALVMDLQGDPGGPADPRLVEAEALLQRAVAIRPNRHAFWNALGSVYYQSRRLDDAESAYRRATQLSTERIEPFLSRAEVLEWLGREAEIAPMLARLLAARPRDVELRLMLAEIDVQRGDLATGRARLEDALRIDPQSARAAALLRRLPRTHSR